jgi:NTP pyrophosphatase (non-canonical NTP hydrolase)
METQDTLQSSMDRIRRFCEERDWDRFHSPKDLAIGVVTEASELLEIFRFQTDEDMKVLLEDPKSREHIGQELADVLYFVLRFAQRYGFDLLAEFNAKMDRNVERYPVDTAKGSNRKAPPAFSDKEGTR